MAFIRGLTFLIMAFFSGVVSAADTTVHMNADGLHIQDWFHESTQNLSTDLQYAASEGKGLMVLYEQKGCVYCAELHAVNFAKTEITGLIDQSFVVLQLDLNGSEQITDFDGTVLSQSDLARKWDVKFTPTTLIFSSKNAQAQSRAEAESYRLPGYIEPFYYFTALDYYATGEFEVQGFKSFVRQRISALTEQGSTPDTW